MPHFLSGVNLLPNQPPLLHQCFSDGGRRSHVLQERNKGGERGRRGEENKRREEGGEERERSTVSQRWPQVDLVLL